MHTTDEPPADHLDPHGHKIPSLDPVANVVGHELRDATIRPLVEAGIVLLVICLATFAGMVPLHNWLHSMEEQKEGNVTPLSVDRIVPPSPLLEASPNIPTEGGKIGVEPFKHSSLADFRREEEGRLTSYGWIDEQAKIVHVPIETAMQKLLQKGLPARK